MPHQDPDTDVAQLSEELDKWTLALTEDGDILWDETMNRPVTHRGLKAVKQDLLVALDTYEGEDQLDDEFGLDVFEAVRDTPHLQHQVTKTLEYDDYRHNRVETVTNVTVRYEPPGSRNAVVEIDARLSDAQPVRLVFDLFRGTVRVA